MKVTAQLPDKKHFKRIAAESEKWSYVWQAIASDRLRICTSVPDPWGKEWDIRIKERVSKGDVDVKTNRVDLTCYPLGENTPTQANILLEFQWGGIPHSNQPTLRFYAIPADEKRVLMLSIVAANLVAR